MDLRYYSMFRSNELTKYTLRQLSYEECSQVTDCFQNRLLMRDALAKCEKRIFAASFLSVCPSALLHGRNGLPLVGFS
jgi:hypothetical protein